MCRNSFTLLMLQKPWFSGSPFRLPVSAAACKYNKDADSCELLEFYKWSTPAVNRREIKGKVQWPGQQGGVIPAFST